MTRSSILAMRRSLYFAINIGRNIGKNISKNLSSKCRFILNIQSITITEINKYI